MKTKPTGIRFDEDELAFIKKRENLETPQSIVNFLMKEYVKMYRVEKPSVFASEQPKVYDAPKFKNPVHDESKQWQEPKPVISQLESWKKDMLACEDIYELQTLTNLMKKDTTLIWSEKNELERFGLQVYKQKGFA